MLQNLFDMIFILSENIRVNHSLWINHNIYFIFVIKNNNSDTSCPRSLVRSMLSNHYSQMDNTWWKCGIICKYIFQNAFKSQIFVALVHCCIKPGKGCSVNPRDLVDGDQGQAVPDVHLHHSYPVS